MWVQTEEEKDIQNDDQSDEWPDSLEHIANDFSESDFEWSPSMEEILNQPVLSNTPEVLDPLENLDVSNQSSRSGSPHSGSQQET